jgi:hypothetical protein
MKNNWLMDWVLKPILNILIFKQSGDESLEYELKIGEHLRITSGTVRVRVSAGGHRVYMGSGVMGTAANYQIFK